MHGSAGHTGQSDDTAEYKAIRIRNHFHNNKHIVEAFIAASLPLVMVDGVEAPLQSPRRGEKSIVITG